MNDRRIPTQKPRSRRQTLATAVPKCDLTPLLDMTFVLTFLFLAMLFQRPALTRLPIRLAAVGGEMMKPRADQGTNLVDIPILIRADGQIQVQQQTFTTKQFATYCQQLKSHSDMATVAVAVDRDTPHHAVAFVLQMLRTDGINADLITAPVPQPTQDTGMQP